MEKLEKLRKEIDKLDKMIAELISKRQGLSNKILEDFKKACKPKSISVRGDFSPRGGIKTEVKRSE